MRKQRQRPAGTSESSGSESAGKSKNDLARERLEPLEEGERPLVVTIAAVLALLIALSNIVLIVIGVEVEEASTSGGIVFAAIMLLAAYGLWRARYWAVLGFQALLAIVILLTALSMIVAASIWAAFAELALLLAAGAMFWFMVKALARIQMPKRPSERS